MNLYTLFLSYLLIDYQENNDLFCFIVNYHALTTVKDSDVLKKNTIEAVLLRPDRYILGTATTLSELSKLLLYFEEILIV